MNNLRFYIPELNNTYYGPIVISAIMIGLIISCILMYKADVRKETLIYTSIFTFVCIFIFSAMISIALSGDIRRVGFVGAGGALGLLVGAIISALIHQDHISESISAWIISSPLMYGLSKIGCHIAGCCNGIPYDGLFRITYASKGHHSYFPVQLTETIVFVIIFLIGFKLYLKSESKLKTAGFILLLSGISKVLLEFLRESHMGKVISGYQILVLAITLTGTSALLVLNHKLYSSRTA